MHFRIILFSLVLGQALATHATDWPQWRGPTRNGIAGKGLALTSLPDQPTVLWKIKSGEGLASPVVANQLFSCLKTEMETKQWSPCLLRTAPNNGTESPVFEDGQEPAGHAVLCYR